jgi:hypothetical protein
MQAKHARSLVRSVDRRRSAHPTALGMAKFDHDRDVSELERKLVAATDEHGGALESYFARARSIVLLTANSPAFANVLAEPGSRAEKVRRHSRSIREVTHQLDYLERLYPTSIGEACFIDANGEEFARAVRGESPSPRTCPPQRSRRPSLRQPSR